MGAGSWSADAWTSHVTSTVGKSTSTIFKSRGMHASLDPKNINRESRDSEDNPLSNAIIVGIDVTGSMGMVADIIAREGLGVLFQEILDRKPVSDPHLMFMAIGDAYYDRAPLQVSQFEADNRIVEQLTHIYVEGGGGGNGCESYDLPWYFAGKHTSIDCYEKRGKKGYLFTVGDEPAPHGVTVAHFSNLFGDNTSDLSASEMLAMAQKYYNVFHIVLTTIGHCAIDKQSVMNSWKALLPERIIELDDYTKLSEVIVSTIQVMEGEDKARVASSWSGSTAVTVNKAISSLVVTENSVTRKNAVVRL